VSLDGRLAVLGRRSIFDALEVLALADEEPLTPRCKELSNELTLRRADGGSFELRVSTREAEEASAT
jgi:hypothetical protein